MTASHTTSEDSTCGLIAIAAVLFGAIDRALVHEVGHGHHARRHCAVDGPPVERPAA